MQYAFASHTRRTHRSHTTQQHLPIHVHTQNAQACDRSQNHLRAVEIGEAMLAAGHRPLPRTVACVIRGADRGMLYERVGVSAMKGGRGVVCVCLHCITNGDKKKGAIWLGFWDRCLPDLCRHPHYIAPHLPQQNTTHKNRASPFSTPPCPWRPRRWASRSLSTWPPESTTCGRS